MIANPVVMLSMMAEFHHREHESRGKAERAGADKERLLECMRRADEAGVSPLHFCCLFLTLRLQHEFEWPCQVSTMIAADVVQCRRMVHHACCLLLGYIVLRSNTP